MAENLKDLEKELGGVRTQLDKVSEALDKVTSDVKEGNTVFGKFADTLSATSGPVATLKKVMYGFLPPGTFRMVNKIIVTAKALDKVTKPFMKGGMGGSLKNFFKVDTTNLDKAMDQYRLYNKIAGESEKKSKTIRKWGSPDIHEKKARRFSQSAKGFHAEASRERAHILTGDLFRKENRIARIEHRKAQLLAIKKFFTFKPMQKISGSFKVLKKVALMAGRFFFVTSMVLVGLFAIIMAVGPIILETLKGVWEIIKIGIGFIWAGISTIWEGLTDIWNGFFGEGDISDVLIGLGKIFWGVVQILWGLLITIGGALLTFIGGLIIESLKKIGNYVLGGNSIGDKIFRGVQVIITLFAVMWALSLGLPLLIVAGIGALVWAAVKWIGGLFGFHADGGIVSTPMQIVGERGPELVSLPRGSRVHTNSQSRKMGGGTVNHFNITINARDTSDAELRRIADKIGNMVNNKVNRTTSSRTLG